MVPEQSEDIVRTGWLVDRQARDVDRLPILSERRINGDNGMRKSLWILFRHWKMFKIPIPYLWIITAFQLKNTITWHWVHHPVAADLVLFRCIPIQEGGTEFILNTRKICNYLSLTSSTMATENSSKNQSYSSKGGEDWKKKDEGGKIKGKLQVKKG